MSLNDAFKSRRPGSLHRALNVPEGQRIPIKKLQWAVRNLPKPLAARASLVLRLNYRRSA